MKKLIILAVLLTSHIVSAQDPLYLKISERLKAEHPEISINGKLLVVSVWSPADQDSRNANSRLDKAYATYESAKLKGGIKGMVGINIGVGEDVSLNEVTLGKDRISKNISVSPAGMNIKEIRNIIFDSNGEVVKMNFRGDIFNEVNAMITR